MKKRSENGQREIRKIAKKRAIRKATIFLLTICSIVAIYFLILLQAARELQDSSETIGIVKILAVCLIPIFLVSILVGRYLMYPNEIEKEVKKRSVILVENFLSKYSRKKVISIRRTVRNYMFSTELHQSNGNFYATLEDEYVKIEFKYENDTSYIFVENIEKELFAEYYELNIDTNK